MLCIASLQAQSTCFGQVTNEKEKKVDTSYFLLPKLMQTSPAVTHGAIIIFIC